MDSHYVVSFTAGTSGRFLAAIISQLVYDLKIIWEYSKYNSCHVRGHVSARVDHRNNGGPHSPNFWKNLTFYPTSDLPIGIEGTHVYPNWDDLRNHELEIKPIIITYTPKDVYETETNGFYKNVMEALDETPEQQLERDPHFIRSFAASYYRHFGKKFDKSVPLDLKTIEELCLVRGKKISPPNDVFSFYSHNLYVPDDFSNKVLIVPYSELFTESENGYLILDRLSNFVGRPINDITLQNYKNYVNGRHNFIKNYAPWILNPREPTANEIKGWDI